jgi:hypothetical protein
MKSSYRTSPDTTARTFIWALALFAILCGIILLFTGLPTGGACGADTEDQEVCDPRQVEAALEEVEEATHALEAMDYGETRTHLNEAARALRALRERTPDEHPRGPSNQ